MKWINLTRIIIAIHVLAGVFVLVIVGITASLAGQAAPG